MCCIQLLGIGGTNRRGGGALKLQGFGKGGHCQTGHWWTGVYRVSQSYETCLA